MGTKFANEKQKEKGEKNKITKYKKQKVNNKQGVSGVQEAQKDPHVHDRPTAIRSLVQGVTMPDLVIMKET
jgi:hypothetical protein